MISFPRIQLLLSSNYFFAFSSLLLAATFSAAPSIFVDSSMQLPPLTPDTLNHLFAPEVRPLSEESLVRLHPLALAFRVLAESLHIHPMLLSTIGILIFFYLMASILSNVSNDRVVVFCGTVVFAGALPSFYSLEFTGPQSLYDGLALTLLGCAALFIEKYYPAVLFSLLACLVDDRSVVAILGLELFSLTANQDNKAAPFRSLLLSPFVASVLLYSFVRFSVGFFVPLPDLYSTLFATLDVKHTISFLQLRLWNCCDGGWFVVAYLMSNKKMNHSHQALLWIAVMLCLMSSPFGGNNRELSAYMFPVTLVAFALLAKNEESQFSRRLVACCASLIALLAPSMVLSFGERVDIKSPVPRYVYLLVNE